MPPFYTHLDSLKDVPEDGPLLPLVRLGSVLVAVCGQRVQFVAKLIPVLELEILQERDGNAAFLTQERKKYILWRCVVQGQGLLNTKNAWLKTKTLAIQAL